MSAKRKAPSAQLIHWSPAERTTFAHIRRTSEGESMEAVFGHPGIGFCTGRPSQSLTADKQLVTCQRCTAMLAKWEPRTRDTEALLIGRRALAARTTGKAGSR